MPRRWFFSFTLASSVCVIALAPALLAAPAADQDAATANFFKGLSGTRLAVAEIVAETVRETNARIVTVGSWVSGSTYQDPLRVGGTSDHDMRLLLPEGSTEEAAIRSWRATRDTIAAKVRARFPSKAEADRVLASTHL